MITKKVKTNPKYSDVKSVVNHGKTMKDVQVISDQLVAKRKGENFGRIQATTLAKLLNEVNNEESVFGLMKSAQDAEDKENNFDVQSTTGSVMSMGAESTTSAVTYTTDMLGITSETKFILLDLRDEDEYKQYHIREAISFPAPNISRDKIFASLLRFKNHSDKIIAVYMHDERNGTHYAKLLHEKGFDNVYLLTGGIEGFLESQYELVEGMNVPAKPKPAAKTATKKPSTAVSVMSSTATSKMTQRKK